MRRVVVTGLGLVTPLGADVETVWKNLLASKSGAGKITRFDTSDHKCHIACEVKPADHEFGFDPNNPQPLLMLIAEDKKIANELAAGYDIRPTIAVTQAHVILPEVIEALQSGRLKADGKFLTAGGVFDDDQIDAFIELKMQEVMRFEMTPHPVEFDMYYSA